MKFKTIEMKPKTMAWISLAFVVWMAITAYLEHNLTMGQMVATGNPNGIPFLKHPGMLSELMLLPFVVYRIWKHAAQWSAKQVVLATLVAFPLAFAAHVMFLTYGVYQQELMIVPHGFTAMGLQHSFYMTALLALIILFAFATVKNTTETKHDKFVVTMLLGFHVPLSVAAVNLVKNGTLDGNAIGSVVAGAILLIWAWRQLLRLPSQA